LEERSHNYIKLDNVEKPVAVSAQNRFDGALRLKKESQPGSSGGIKLL
jgi:hypothetical protein